MKISINNEKIIFFIVIIITLLLYYGIRVNEENNEKLNEKKKEEEKSSDNKLTKGHIEDNIHLNNSKLLNTKVTVEEIKKVILKEKMEKEREENENKETFRVQLWMIETISLSFFLIVMGGLYFYLLNESKKLKNNKKEIYSQLLNSYKFNESNYNVIDSEKEYLINKDDDFNSNAQYDD